MSLEVFAWEELLDDLYFVFKTKNQRLRGRRRAPAGSTKHPSRMAKWQTESHTWPTGTTRRRRLCWTDTTQVQRTESRVDTRSEGLKLASSFIHYFFRPLYSLQTCLAPATWPATRTARSTATLLTSWDRTRQENAPKLPPLSCGCKIFDWSLHHFSRSQIVTTPWTTWRKGRASLLLRRCKRCRFMAHRRWSGVEGKMAKTAGRCPNGRGHTQTCGTALQPEEEEVGAATCWTLKQWVALKTDSSSEQRRLKYHISHDSMKYLAVVVSLFK